MRIENSFIPVEGVGETTERRLWEDGVTNWDEFDSGDLGPTKGRRVAKYIDVARDHLDRGETRFFGETLPTGCHWRLYENVRSSTCFLDIETTGLDEHRDAVTVVGLHRDGETKTLVRGRDLTSRALQRELAHANLLVTFNGKRFDVPFLESAFDLTIDLPHVDLMYPCRRLDLNGGLKSIEREVGIDRDGEDLSGRDAVRLWHEYERGHVGALETLLEYNRADTSNLEVLADHVVSRLHETVFESAIPDQ